MSRPTGDGRTAAEFFAELGSRDYEPLLHAASGTMRFDLVEGSRVDCWYLAIERGQVAVSRRRSRADCVVRVPRELFDRIASGEANAMTAMLRGEIDIEGDPQLMLLFQRLFPGPRASKPSARAGGKQT